MKTMNNIAHLLLTSLFITICCLGIASGEGDSKPNETKWKKMSVVELRDFAEKGNADAQYELGKRYINLSADRYDDARDIQHSYEDAILWLRKSAQQGNVEAQYLLGYKLGCEVDGNSALVRYKKILGYKSWETNDAEFVKVKKSISDVEAAKWMLMAAEQGDSRAQYDMSIRYRDGRGVPKNNIEEYKWMNLAAMQDVSLRSYREDVAQNLTPSQIAEAQRRSSVFRPRKPAAVINDDKELPSDPIGSGTGFFITTDGYLITAAHVVESASQIRVKAAQGTLPAKVIKVDVANDVAILKVQGDKKPIPIAPSRRVKLGDSVFTLGFPNVELQGFNPKLTKGEISSLTGMQDDARFFQISVAIQPGNSGGPLVDMTGNVVGILVSKLDDVKALQVTGSMPQNVNYAIKSSYILALLETFPDISGTLPSARILNRSFEDVVKDVEAATALVLVY